MMEKRYFELGSRTDKLGIAVLAVLPEEDKKIKGVVQIVHGMCEYKERYLPFMEYLASQGYASVIHDHRGHGNSVKKKEDLGYMYEGGAEAVMDDTFIVQNWCRKEFPAAPLIFLGHSMGTLVVRACIRQSDKNLAGVILTGTPKKNSLLWLGNTIAQAEKLIRGGRHHSKLLEDLSFAPNVLKFWKEKNKYAWLCSDKQIVKEYTDDPLCGVTFTDDAYLTLFSLMKQAYTEKEWMCDDPRMPILFLGGAEDPCIGGVKEFAKSILSIRMAGYCMVKGHLYREMRHEILNEKGKEKVYRDIVAFLNRKCI